MLVGKYLTCREIHSVFYKTPEQVTTILGQPTWLETMAVRYECRIPYRWLRRRDKIRHLFRKLFRRVYGYEIGEAFNRPRKEIR